MKKPMLLSNDEFDLEDLDYENMFISEKRDGVRAELINNKLVGRSLKPFRNPKLHKYFENLKIRDGFIIEGEIYCDGIPCREMAGICNSKDKEIPKGTKLYIFGAFDPIMSFEERYNWLKTNIENTHNIELVEQDPVWSARAVEEYFDSCIQDGFEGSVLMDGRKQYKEGRVTINQHIGFKLKPFKEEDLEIIGVTERFENTNESQKNELGQSYKRNTVDAKESTGIAATFICKMPNSDETTKVTITGDEAYRRNIWSNQKNYIGAYAVVKSMDYGTKDKLRHPTLIKIKESCEK